MFRYIKYILFFICFCNISVAFAESSVLTNKFIKNALEATAKYEELKYDKKFFKNNQYNADYVNEIYIKNVVIYRENMFYYLNELKEKNELDNEKIKEEKYLNSLKCANNFIFYSCVYSVKRANYFYRLMKMVEMNYNLEQVESNNYTKEYDEDNKVFIKRMILEKQRSSNDI